MQHVVTVVTQGEQGFRRVRRQLLRSLAGTFRGLASTRPTGIQVPGYVEKGVCSRKLRPGNGKIGVKLNRPLIKTGGLQDEIAIPPGGAEAADVKSQTTQISIVGLRIVCGF